MAELNTTHREAWRHHPWAIVLLILLAISFGGELVLGAPPLALIGSGMLHAATESMERMVDCLQRSVQTSPMIPFPKLCATAELDGIDRALAVGGPRRPGESA
jgi:hypothetical protein